LGWQDLVLDLLVLLCFTGIIDRFIVR